MYTIEQCLDAILLKLKENWNNSGGRKFLKCEEMMTEFGFPPDYRKHEFFIRLINRLSNDNYAEFTQSPFPMIRDIKYYQEETLITVEGYYFIENGGYVKQLEDKIAKEQAISDQIERTERNEERLVDWTRILAVRTDRLSFWTILVAIGACGLVVWEVVHYLLERFGSSH